MQQVLLSDRRILQYFIFFWVATQILQHFAKNQDRFQKLVGLAHLNTNLLLPDNRSVSRCHFHADVEIWSGLTP